MSRLILIRHGKTLANEQHLYCSKTDLPLSEKGRSELNLLKAQLSYPSGDFFISSGLLRANETLRLLTGKQPDLILPELAEYDFGRFEMQSYEQLKDSAEYQAWITDQTGTVSCPGGESRAEFQARVKVGLQRLLELSGRHSSLFVVCHGGVIVRLMQELAGDGKNFYEWQPEAGHGYILKISNGILRGYSSL